MKTDLQALDLSRVLDKLESPRGGGNQYVALCPAHPDRNPSLSITLSHDKILLKCHAGCDIRQVTDAAGISIGDLFQRGAQRAVRSFTDDWLPRKPYGDCDSDCKKVAEYPYRDALGNVLYYMVRCTKKHLRPKRSNPDKPGQWKWSLGDTPRVLYRLPQVLAADPDLAVYLVEGEKDVDRLWDEGFPATCKAFGGNGWKPELLEPLRDRDVIIVQDRDEAGFKSAMAAAKCLMDIAHSVEVVRAREGKDASDHFNAGLKARHLVTLGYPKPYLCPCGECPDCVVAS